MTNNKLAFTSLFRIVCLTGMSLLLSGSMGLGGCDFDMAQKNRCYDKSDCIENRYCDIERGEDKGKCVSPPMEQILDIPPRDYWREDNGYTGSSCIQQIALYYGMYISQKQCRQVGRDINSDDATGEILVGEYGGNAAAVLSALRFTTVSWDCTQPTERQYQEYLVWIKQHLYSKAPVIITAYLKGFDSNSYDIMFLAVGFESADTTTYHEEDLLYYNNPNNSVSTSFAMAWNNRDMTSSSCETECIPENCDFGIAVTGIKDDDDVTRPVLILLDENDEPSIPGDEAPILLTFTVEVMGLKKGESYALLRYNDYTAVPTRDFDAGSADACIIFEASNNTMRLINQTVQSDQMTIFRCVPANKVLHRDICEGRH